MVRISPKIGARKKSIGEKERREMKRDGRRKDGKRTTAAGKLEDGRMTHIRLTQGVLDIPHTWVGVCPVLLMVIRAIQ